MADDSLKKLLVKLGISTTEWKKNVQDIKAQLKEIQNQAIKDFQARQSEQRKELDLTKQQIADQQKLRAEAEAMAAVDKAKAAWHSQQAAAIKEKLAQTLLETAETKKQTVEQQNLLKIEQEKNRLQLQQLKLQEQQTKEVEKQKLAEAKVPSVAGVSGIRATVATAVSSDVVQKIQTEAMRQLVTQERAKLATQEAQLRVLMQQEGVRKVDVEVVQKEVTQERAKLSLIENQLRLRELEEKQMRLQQEQAARVPSTTGVAGLRTGMQAASAVQLTKEQTLQIEKQITEERAKLLVQEAQLRVMSTQEGVRKADIGVLEKEIAQERARLGLQEAQLRMSRGPAEPGGGEGGGGFLGGALLSLGGGLFGTGLTGMMATGVAAGELFEKMLEKLGEKIREIGHEMLEAAGPAGALREQFEKLSKREGVVPDEFLNKLRIATRGLVEDNTQLIKVANQFMSGPLKLEPEQVVKLTGLTVNLARATAGSPNSVELAMQALSRTALTGRAYQLAYAVGIDTSQLKMRGLGKEAETTAGKQIQLATIIDAMTRRFAEVGTPMTTVKDLYSQLHMVSAAFNEDLAYGITHSTAFAGAIESISKWLQKITPEVLDFASSLGDHLGEAFGTVQQFINSFLKPLIQTEQELQKAYVRLLEFVGIKPPDEGWKEAMADMSLGFISVAYWIEKATTKLKTWAGMTVAVAGGDIKAAIGIYKEGQEALKALDQQLLFDVTKNFADRQAPTRIDVGEAGPPKKVPTQEEASTAKQIAAVNLKIKEEEEKAKLDLALQRIEQEKEANREAYDSGLISLQDFVNKEKAILEKEHAAKLAMIHADADARRAQLAEDAKGMTYRSEDEKDASGKVITPGKVFVTPGMPTGLRRAKEKEIAVQENAQIEAENLRAGKEEYANQKQILADQIAARREYVSAINKIEQDGVKERIRILDEEFKQGVGTADQYLASKRDLIEQEFVLREQALAQEATANKNNAAELAKIRIQFVEAEMDKEKQLQELEVHEGQIRLESIRTRYQQAKEILDAEAIQAAQPGPVGEGRSEVATIQAQQRLTTNYLKSLQVEQDRIWAQTHSITPEWVAINKEIYSAVQEQVKLNTELAKAKDLAGPLGQMFGTIASEFGSLLSAGSKNTLDQLAKSLETLSKVQTGMAAQTGGLGGLFKSTGKSFTDLFHHTALAPQKAVQTAQEIFENGLKSAATKVDTFGANAVATAQKLADGASVAISKLGEGVGASATKIDSAVDRTVASLDKLTGAVSSAAGKITQQTIRVVPEKLPTPETPEVAPSGASGIVGTIPGTSGDIAGSAQTAEVSAPSSGALVQTTSDLSYAGDKVTAVLDKVAGKGNDFAERLKDFTDKVTAVIQAVGAAVSTILGAKTTKGGAAAGALSTGMLGMSIGANFGPLGAAIGAGAGAVLGGVMGGLVGHKRAEMQKQVDTINAHFKAVIDALQNNTMSMGDAVKQLQAARGAAFGSLNQSKKGRKQLPAIMDQFNAEIDQLMQQQKKILDDLHTQLAILSEPTAFQPIMTQLEDIIKKYQEYASAAAGNTTDVANANAFLVKSLQAYALTLSTDVNDAEQQAIQNKLHLMDVQQQQIDMARQEFEMVAQYKQQVYDIMTSGVTTRQRTTAMSKGEELAKAKYDFDTQQKQMDLQKIQLDAEQNLTQMKVDAESKIFNLATTRIDLETQLLGLQAQQEGLSIAHIQALQQALSQLNAATGAGGTLPAGMLNATGGVDVQAIEQLLGLPTTNIASTPAGQPAIQNMPPIYQQFLDVFDKNPATSGFSAQLLAAAQTPVGSSQRHALDQELASNPAYGKELVAAGVVQKPVHGVSYDSNWLSFFGWILNKMQATQAVATGGEPVTPTPAGAPELDVGGRIAETGAAIVHKGEGIFSTAAVPIFQKMTDGMEKFGNIIARYIQGIGDRPARPAAPVQQGPGDVLPHPVLLGSPVQPLLDAHKSIFDLSSVRVSMESRLLDKHKEVIALDMQRIAAMRNLSASGAGVVSLEGALAQVYELRGRQGAGGFYKENL